MLRVYSKAVAGVTVVPALRKVPLLGARVGAGSGELPERELVRSQVRVDRERLAAYDRVCGFRLRDELPPTYPHIVAFPLAMELMTSSSFPFPAMGLVHIANRIELRRPLPAGEAFSLRVWAAHLREHERGTQFDIRAEASVAEEPVWLSSSTYLHRERGGEKGSSARMSEEAPGAPQAIWDVPRDIGRRYGAVSGDRNPIHLHPVTAKLFGMRSHIAHGMWTKARCLAALEGELPEAYTVEARFKLAIFLPARVGFSAWQDGDTRRFAVRDAGDGKPHLDGSVAAVPA